MTQAAAPAPVRPPGGSEYFERDEEGYADIDVDDTAAPPSDPDKKPTPADNLPGGLGKAYMNKDSVFDGAAAKEANKWSQRKGKGALAVGALLSLSSFGLPFTAYAAGWAWSAHKAKKHPEGTPGHEKWASRQFAFAHPRQTSAAVGGVLDKLDTKKPNGWITFAAILFGIPAIFSVGAGAGVVGLAISALAAPVVGTAMVGRHFKVFRRARLALKHRGVAGKQIKLQRNWFEKEFLEKGNQPPERPEVKYGPHPSSPDHKQPTLDSPEVAGPKGPDAASPAAPEKSTPSEPATAEMDTTPAAGEEPAAPEPPATDQQTAKREPQPPASGEVRRKAHEQGSLPAEPTASHLRGVTVTPGEYQRMLFHGRQTNGMDTQFTYYQAELDEVVRLLQERRPRSRDNAMKEARRAVAAFNIDQPRDTATRELLGALYSIGYAGKGARDMSSDEMSNLAQRVSARASNALAHGEPVSYHYGRALESPRQAQRSAVKAQQAESSRTGSGGLSL